MLRGRSINCESSLLDALKLMDALDKKLLVVLRKDKFGGLISIGDIQRAIIQNKSLETSLINITRNNIKIARVNDSFSDIKEMMFNYRMELCPVVSEENEIISIYFWEDVFGEQEPAPLNKFNLPVVIMAGGFGSRLKPMTNVIPKPLIPIGDKTIIEQIFQRFNKYSCDKFYVSVNYKAELIEFYLSNLKLPFSIEYFKEDKPLGTAGSLSLLEGKLSETFFVSNCDIIIDQDYSEMLEYHRNNGNEITIITALKHYSIPYGIVESSENGNLVSLSEKPELTFKINSGMYILEPHLLKEIPQDQFFHITHLIDKIRNRNGKIGVFPVSENSWIDIGEWPEYLKRANIL